MSIEERPTQSRSQQSHEPDWLFYTCTLHDRPVSTSTGVFLGNILTIKVSALSRYAQNSKPPAKFKSIVNPPSIVLSDKTQCTQSEPPTVFPTQGIFSSWSPTVLTDEASQHETYSLVSVITLRSAQYCLQAYPRSRTSYLRNACGS